MVKLNEAFMETDNGAIREYLDTMDDIKRMLGDTDWDFDSVMNEDAVAILEDMANSDRGVVKLGKVIQSAKNMKNAIEDANFELDGIYELLADWGNLRL